jgi:nucleoside-diphosphate-sugar epimerase
MRIFVAGGSGRVATELIKDLIADGNTVVAGAAMKTILLS